METLKTLDEINYYRCIGEHKRSFSNELFILSALQKKDIETIRLWRNKKIELLRQNKILSKEEQEKYWNDSILISFKQDKPKNILMRMARKDSEELIAYGGLVHIDWDKYYAETSFLVKSEILDLSPEYEEIFLNFFDLMIDLVKFLGVQTLYSETYSFRTSHISLIEKIGYKEYGFLRKKCSPQEYSVLHQLEIK